MRLIASMTAPRSLTRSDESSRLRHFVFAISFTPTRRGQLPADCLSRRHVSSPMHATSAPCVISVRAGVGSTGKIQGISQKPGGAVPPDRPIHAQVGSDGRLPRHHPCLQEQGVSSRRAGNPSLGLTALRHARAGISGPSSGRVRPRDGWRRRDQQPSTRGRHTRSPGLAPPVDAGLHGPDLRRQVSAHPHTIGHQ
jgi:hypothetical protein